MRGGVTQYTYTANHLLLTVTDPRGGVTRIPMTATVNSAAQTDPLGRTTTYTYVANPDGTVSTAMVDQLGNVTIEVSAGGQPLTLTKGYGTAAQATWSYTYDAATQEVASVTAPNGPVDTFTWDARGNMLS